MTLALATPYNIGDSEEPAGCGEAADCAKWRSSGCQKSTLVGRNPALETAIVDVRAFAGDQRTHEVVVTTRHGWNQFGVAVEFFSASCAEVQVPWAEPSVHAAVKVDPAHPAYFRIPAGVRWMTVVAVDAINVEWAMY